MNVTAKTTGSGFRAIRLTHSLNVTHSDYFFSVEKVLEMQYWCGKNSLKLIMCIYIFFLSSALEGKVRAVLLNLVES